MTPRKCLTDLTRISSGPQLQKTSINILEDVMELLLSDVSSYYYFTIAQNARWTVSEARDPSFLHRDH